MFVKRIWLWARLLLSFGLITFLIFSVEIRNFSVLPINIAYKYFLGAIVIAIADRILMAYKWNILLKAKEINIPLINLTGIYLVSTFLGLFLPATVGGDAVRAYAVAKGGHKLMDAISSIIVERLFGMISLFIFVLISIFSSALVFKGSFFLDMWDLLILVLILLIILLFIIAISLFLPKFANISVLKRPDNRIYENRYVSKLMEIYHSYLLFKDKRVELGLFLILSFLENLFPIFWNYFLSLALNINIPLIYLFILTPIVLVLVRLPISFDGIGIQEGAFVFFLSYIGIPKSEALLLGIASHIIAILSILPGGILYGISGLNSINKTTKLSNGR